MVNNEGTEEENNGRGLKRNRRKQRRE